MIVKILLDNVEYYILYSPIKTKKKVKFYKPLAEALWSTLTEQRKQTLIINFKDSKILNFDKLLECYLHNSTITQELNLVTAKGHTPNKEKFKYFNNKKHGCCACGVPIKWEAIIKNIDTKTRYIIGCKCILSGGNVKKI